MWRAKTRLYFVFFAGYRRYSWSLRRGFRLRLWQRKIRFGRVFLGSKPFLEDSTELLLSLPTSRRFQRGRITVSMVRWSLRACFNTKRPLRVRIIQKKSLFTSNFTCFRFRTLYFHSIVGWQEFSVSTRALRNETLALSDDMYNQLKVGRFCCFVLVILLFFF